VRFYIDGVLAFENMREHSTSGRIGLYCTNQSRVRFLQFKVSPPVWQNFAAFGLSPDLQPGTKVTVLGSAPGAGVPASVGGKVVYAAALEDSGRICFPGQAQQVRLLARSGEIVHARQFRPARDYGDIAVRVLRKADGTGILLFPQPFGDGTSQLKATPIDSKVSLGLPVNRLAVPMPIAQTASPTFSPGICRLHLTFYRNRQAFDPSDRPKTLVWSQAGDEHPEEVAIDIPI
jgi:hypothetical protein